METRQVPTLCVLVMCEYSNAGQMYMYCVTTTLHDYTGRRVYCVTTTLAASLLLVYSNNGCGTWWCLETFV